jgi:hypothetical protein
MLESAPDEICASPYGLGSDPVRTPSTVNALPGSRPAETRGRPVENRWIGQRIDNPAVDIAALARSQGALGYGPVRRRDELATAMTVAVAEVRGGAPVVIDVLVDSVVPKILLGKR